MYALMYVLPVMYANLCTLNPSVGLYKNASIWMFTRWRACFSARMRSLLLQDASLLRSHAPHGLPSLERTVDHLERTERGEWLFSRGRG